MLSTIERRQEIVKMVEQKGSVAVNDLALHFDISAVSIRTDLNVLSKRGLVVRSRGGAVPVNRLSKELSLHEKHKKNHRIKQKLGAAVAALIDDSDTIILDSGTTTEEVASCLLEKQNLTVMTNGLNIANELARTENCQVLITGGSLRRKSMSFYGAHAEDNLRKYNFNKVILGVDGIDVSKGISTHYEPEAQFNRAMCESAQQIIVVTDSSKFGKCSLHSIIDMDKIDILVTDDDMPDEYREKLEALNIEVVLVKK